MNERRKPREVETTKLILSMNWKEGLLLQKRLLALDFLKKQVADSYTLDQSILYNRFRTKLQCSELTHARLMGRRDLMEQLKSRPSRNFNTKVTDDSKAAVREILQRTSSNHNVRRQRYPTRSNPRQTVSQRGARAGTAVGKKARQGIEKSGVNQFAAVTPESSTPSISPEGFLSQRPCTVTGVPLGPERSEQPQAQGRRRTAWGGFVEFSADAEQSDACGRAGSQRPGSSRINRGQVRKSALSIFLNIGEREEMPSLLDIHARLVGEAKLDDRVRRFLAETHAEEWGAARLGDYYSERLLATVTARSATPALDKGPSGWDFVGKEMNYRSITFKKLVVDCFSKPCPASDLVLEKVQ